MDTIEKTADREEFIKKIADELDTGLAVYFNLETLEYGTIMEERIEEYGDYLDMADEYLVEETEDWDDDERSFLASLRRIMEFPDHLDPPESHIQFQWMVDFTDDHASNRKFFQYAERALNRRHPFRGFKDTLLYNGLEKEWYAYRKMRMQNWVRRELPFYKTPEYDLESEECL